MSTLHIEMQTQIYNPSCEYRVFSVRYYIYALEPLFDHSPENRRACFRSNNDSLLCQHVDGYVLVKHRIPSNNFSFGHLQFYSCELYLLADHSMCTCNWVVVVGKYFHSKGKDKISEITFGWCITAMRTPCRLDTIFIKIFRNFIKYMFLVKDVHLYNDNGKFFDSPAAEILIEFNKFHRAHFLNGPNNTRSKFSREHNC